MTGSGTLLSRHSTDSKWTLCDHSRFASKQASKHYKDVSQSFLPLHQLWGGDGSIIPSLAFAEIVPDCAWPTVTVCVCVSVESANPRPLQLFPVDGGIVTA